MNELFCGIDLGTRSSSFCVFNGKKEVVKRWEGSNRRIRAELSELSGKMRCVVEAAPLAESVCNEVEKLGAQIEIIDSRHTKGLIHGKKTDRVDAETLAELALLGWYKPIFRKSGLARERRTVLSGRAALVNVSTQTKNTIRGLLKASGIVLPSGGEGLKFAKIVHEAIKPLSSDVQRTIEDLLSVWMDAHIRQKRAYVMLNRIASKDIEVSRLMSVPGVGPATALCFAATIVNPARFKDPKQVVGYLGLAPRVHQSGETHFHGRITKQGDKLTRWLLIEAANIILTRVRSSFPLRPFP